MLERQISIYKSFCRLNVVTELQILKALVLEGMGKKSLAIDAINIALEIAESAGFTRVFLDQGPILKPLLERAKLLNIHPTYAEYILRAFDGPVPEGEMVPQPLVDPLSERELEVLRLLRTNLTTPEIADEMVIGVNTVRSHIKNIYSKLVVHKRSEAVNRAVELGLLSGN
jgi:LuxR family maltose regulon positive regulatory protein